MFLAFKALTIHAMAESSSAHLAGDFTRRSLTLQRAHDATVVATIAKSVVIFDSTNFFSDAEQEIISGICVKKKNGKYAVLSDTAQAVFTDKNQYVQFTTNQEHIKITNEGVILSLMVRRKIMEMARANVEYVT
uniref:DNA-directed RNA polymerase subunit beta n=1 Tax=Lygus hesperus TaxID=30085 RepID=A0A0A9YLR6_LYGHE